ncbi:hypothetical protein SLS55_009609 [Diplodia seriata]|uniref:DUF7580 domain-containing protein n=1 Tax=Diplodia seriata TaxID=420778 RepID=A0ABR3C5L8_9PEZI
MSGFEVAGLVLGVIPIALKSYTELGAFFADFRRYRIQGVRLRLKYANEADLFQASIRTLLSYSIDGNVVSAMLDDPEHASWSDKDIQNSLGMVLDGDLNLCEAVRRNVKKSKVEELLQDSADANRYLGKFVYQAKKRRKYARPALALPKPPIEDTKVIRDSYTKIYRALSAVWADCGCPAHDVELALRCTLNEGSAGILRQTPRDCGVIFHGGPLSKCWYASPEGPSQQQANTENGSAKSAVAGTIVTQGGSTKQIAKGKASTTDFEARQCIKNNCTGNHLTELITYPYERVKIAYVLALSLLRLYDSPWLKEKERWTSDDIRFVTTQSPDIDQRAIPHVTASHQQNASSSGSPPAGKQIFNCVKNYQIYALGIIMLELALGSLLVPTSAAGNVNDPEVAEFLEAHRLNSNTVAGRMLGPRYGRVVSRCLTCDFSVNDCDLNSVSLQAAFYKFVICELEGILNGLSQVSSTT